MSDYERAVNGRGIPDLDIEAPGRERIEPLLKRGVAFAWEALFAANQSLPTVWLTGLISVAPILTDPDEFTGNVTFVSAKSHTDFELGFDTDQAGVLIMLTSADCVDPLPDRVA